MAVKKAVKKTKKNAPKKGKAAPKARKCVKAPKTAKKVANIHVRISPNYHGRIKALAKKSGEKLNDYIVALIAGALIKNTAFETVVKNAKKQAKPGKKGK